MGTRVSPERRPQTYHDTAPPTKGSSGWRGSRAGHYIVAVAAPLLAVFATRVAAPILGSTPVFALFYASVTMVAWYGGFAPAVLTTVISAAAAAILLFPATDWFTGRVDEDAWRLVLFVGVAVLIGVMTSGRRRAEQSLRDLLAREKRARAEAEAANRAKDVFLATVSHELRAPLQAILGWVHVLRTKDIDPGTRRALQTIEQNAKAQATLVGDLLDVSRIVAGKLALDLRPMALQPVVGATVEALRPTADARDIVIDFRADPGPALVMGDAGRLRQVIANLLSNAVKFTPTGGQVVVRLSANGPVTVTVSDTGRGIPRAFIPRLFDPFSQAEDAGRSSQGGLGLGLAIVKHLVELHGGTVQAESAGEGRGATFTVKLPAMPQRSQGPPGGQSQGIEAVWRPLDGLHVLLVEDEVDTRMLVTAILEGYGARVTAVDSAEAALQALDEVPPDVLVSDIGLPGQEGRGLIREVRAREETRGSHLPAVALTAYTGRDEEERSLAAGFDAQLSKPAEPLKLAATVAALAHRFE